MPLSVKTAKLSAWDVWKEALRLWLRDAWPASPTSGSVRLLQGGVLGMFRSKAVNFVVHAASVSTTVFDNLLCRAPVQPKAVARRSI